ncbi:hypothetical protein VD659_05530 [Herbiconiux sp. 11R-BC]|uniref:hypothetical protein n=1 Tax=Herbiconiux sp. 11R-BC TaxID=3111637 RepID=UPI0010F7D7D5
MSDLNESIDEPDEYLTTPLVGDDREDVDLDETEDIDVVDDVDDEEVVDPIFDDDTDVLNDNLGYEE